MTAQFLWVGRGNPGGEQLTSVRFKRFRSTEKSSQSALDVRVTTLVEDTTLNRST
ncbi:MAG: hypothetical protein M3458_12040 [Acidobacteriota bacterium]|nr:hypothetical protein [Acidobacteriota bacterium]